jgi:zinc D-Ala-D-Ala carboxypeptidase
MTLHFSDTELNCKCCNKHNMEASFLDKLEALRIAYAKPIVLNSAYRCEAHNKAVGGAKGSFHIKGRAVDVKLPNVQHQAFIELAMKHGFKGFGMGHNFLHIDDRAKLTKWVY